MPETKLGITVHNDERTAGPAKPANWWDMKDCVVRSLHSYKDSPEDYFNGRIKTRIKEGLFWQDEKTVKKHFLPFAESALTGLKFETKQNDFLNNIRLKLSSVNTDGVNLKRLSRVVSGTSISIAQVPVYGPLKTYVEAALRSSDLGCKAFHEAIMQLLKNSGDVVIDTKFSVGSKQRKIAGQDVHKNKLGASSARMELKSYKLDKRPVIRLSYNSSKYKDNANKWINIEFLAAILYEAGNIFSGVVDIVADDGATESTKEKVNKKRQRAEAPVWVHTSRKVMGVAKQGYTIHQQGWRNLVRVIFATDVNPQLFACTDTAIDEFCETPHKLTHPKFDAFSKNK